MECLLRTEQGVSVHWGDFQISVWVFLISSPNCISSPLKKKCPTLLGSLFLNYFLVLIVLFPTRT